MGGPLIYCPPAGREALEELSPDRCFYKKTRQKQQHEVLTRLRGSWRHCMSKYMQLHLQVRDPLETDAARSSAVGDTEFANTGPVRNGLLDSEESTSFRDRSFFLDSPLGRYLSAEMHGAQTAPLTGSVEIPLTRQETGAPVQKLLPGGIRRPLFGHQRHQWYHLSCIRKGSTATTQVFLYSLQKTEFQKCIRTS